jgi:hypothetical protein
MDPSALDFLIDEDDLTTPHPGACLVRAGTSPTVPAAPAPNAVHDNVPVHEPIAAPAPAPPSPGPWLPGPTSPDATATVHPAQAATSSTTSMEHIRAAGTAAPVACAQAVASKTGRTAATRPVSIISVTNTHSMRTRRKAVFVQSVDRLNLHVVPMSPKPGTYIPPSFSFFLRTGGPALVVCLFGSYVCLLASPKVIMRRSLTHHR